jgi:hypothetical protein
LTFSSVFSLDFLRFFLATLCDAMKQKFGIQASKERLLALVHMPQLFLAMQYHTGTRFQDAPGTPHFLSLSLSFALLLLLHLLILLLLIFFLFFILF